MDINQLFSIIEEKESYTEETISEVKKLLGSFPYFQTGHMLLLKAMRITKPEKFNDQLNISGSFIPNKIKLYKFINADKTVSNNIKKEKVIEKKAVITETETEEEPKVIKKETGIVSETTQIFKENKVQDIKNELKKSITEAKTEKKVEFEVNPIKKEPQVKIQEIKKTETKLTGEGNDKKIIKKSKERHKKIVSDFFIDPSKDVKIIDETTDKTKIKLTKKTVTEDKPGKIVTEDTANKRIRRFDQAIQNETKKEELKKEEKPVLKERIVVEKTKVVEKKTEIIKEEKPEAVKKEKAPVTRRKVEEKKPEEKRKLLSLDNVVSTAGKGKTNVKKQSDVMNDIFSKIRAIKKEMNISSDENPETIDVNTNVNKRKRGRTVEPEAFKKEEKNTESVVKEIQKENVEIKKEEFVKKEETLKGTDKKEDLTVSKAFEEKVKEKDESLTEEKTLTAKDLFKQHQKRKYDNKEVKPVTQTKSKIESLFDNPETSEKSITTSQPEKVQIEKYAVKEEIKIPDTKEIVEKKELATDKKELSAADALLKRIAMKKQKMKTEEQEEKIEKVEVVTPVKEKLEEVDSKLEEKKEEVVPEVKKQEEKTEVEDKKEELTKPAKPKSLIDDFINKSDSLERLTADKEIKLKGDISVKSFEEKEEFMTEAMADLFIQQKYYEKALNVYKKLILKFPQKKTYFAIQIKKVESLIK